MDGGLEKTDSGQDTRQLVLLLPSRDLKGQCRSCGGRCDSSRSSILWGGVAKIRMGLVASEDPSRPQENDGEFAVMLQKENSVSAGAGLEFDTSGQDE